MEVCGATVVEVCGATVVDDTFSEFPTVVDVVTESSSSGKSDIDTKQAPGDFGAFPNEAATDATRTLRPASVG